MAGGKIVEKKEWYRALNRNVVDAVIDQICTDCVVNPQFEGNFQLRSHAVGA